MSSKGGASLNAILQQMLTAIPTGVGLDADAVPSLTITGTGVVVLNDLTLYVTNTANATTAVLDLHNSLVSALIPQLPSGLTGTLAQDGMAELLTLATGSQALPVTLPIATNPLWQALAPISRALTTVSRAQAQTAGMLNPRAASGIWLDVWAATLGVTRHAGEPDALFLLRMAGQTLNPVVNNVAIANLLGTLGYPSTVTNTAPYTFTADITYPTTSPAGFVYTQAQLAAIIGDIQALGVTAVINFLNALSESAGATDALTIASSALSANTWDAIQWGEYAWL